METKLNVINMILTRQWMVVINSDELREFFISKYMKKSNHELANDFYKLTGIYIKPRTSNIFCYA